MDGILDEAKKVLSDVDYKTFLDAADLSAIVQIGFLAENRIFCRLLN